MKLDEIKFEKALLDDAFRLMEVQQLCFREDFDKYGECPAYIEKEEDMTNKIQNSIFYKIVYHDLIIGSIEVYKKDCSHYHLNIICVHPEFQNMGIGKKAIKFLFHSHPDITIWTLVTPLKSFRNRYFYEKLGFRKIEKKIHSEKLTLIKYEIKIDNQIDFQF
jgi:ribosomal protein S18 acetylase RimI-like enzyme